MNARLQGPAAASADAEPKALDYQLKDMELIIHEFGLSGQTYYGFVMKDVTRERAIQRLRELFGDILDPDEFLSLVEYQGDVTLAEAMMEASFVSLASDDVPLTRQEKDVLERREPQLRAAILRAVSVPGVAKPCLPDLARHFAELGLGPRKTELVRDRLLELAGAYLQTLAIISGIG